MDISNTSKSVSSKIMIVFDPIDLGDTTSPITYKVDNFLRGLFGSMVEESDINTISYLLNIVVVKTDLAAGTKTWSFLPENIERVQTVLEGIKPGPDCHIHMTTYTSIRSVLMAMVARTVDGFVPGDHC